MSPYEELLELIKEADSWVKTMEGVPISYYLDWDENLKKRWLKVMEEACNSTS